MIPRTPSLLTFALLVAGGGFAQAQPAPTAAAAPAPIRAHYAAYAGGLNAINLDAEFLVTQQQYRIHLTYRTSGAVGLIVRGEQDTTVEGRFANGVPQPSRFFSAGHMRGRPRVTQIDYIGGQPRISQLVPSNAEDEREAVPEAQQLGTVDTLSAMAELVRQVAATGRCDGRAMTFDGRRLAEMQSRTMGQEMLEPTGRSSFSGPALRCDFVGRQLGGFKTEDDPVKVRQPHRGVAWLASITPGGLMIPVRMQFEAPFFGSATMYLAAPGG